MVHNYTILLERGRTIQGDVLIEESTLNELVRYSTHLIRKSCLFGCKQNVWYASNCHLHNLLATLSIMAFQNNH